MSNSITVTVNGKDYIVYPPQVGYYYEDKARTVLGRRVYLNYRSTRDGKGFGPVRSVWADATGKGVGAQLAAAATEEFGMDQDAYDYMVAEAKK